jgi:hypothetical protein
LSGANDEMVLEAAVKAAAARLAKEDGVSLNHWISVAIAQKIVSLPIGAALRDHLPLNLQTNSAMTNQSFPGADAVLRLLIFEAANISN